jgi:hypothetical protein
LDAPPLIDSHAHISSTGLDGRRKGQEFKSAIWFEQAIETAAMMLGSDKSRGYCLEMICADFLAGANLDSGQPDVLLHSMSRFFQFLPGEQKQAFVQLMNGTAP